MSSTASAASRSIARHPRTPDPTSRVPFALFLPFACTQTRLIAAIGCNRRIVGRPRLHRLDFAIRQLNTTQVAKRQAIASSKRALIASGRPSSELCRTPATNPASSRDELSFATLKRLNRKRRPLRLQRNPAAVAVNHDSADVADRTRRREAIVSAIAFESAARQSGMVNERIISRDLRERTGGAVLGIVARPSGRGLSTIDALVCGPRHNPQRGAHLVSRLPLTV